MIQIAPVSPVLTQVIKPTYSLPENVQFVSDMRTPQGREITYRKTSSSVTLYINCNGECVETEIYQSGVVKCVKRYRVYFPGTDESLRWEVSIMPAKVDLAVNGTNLFHAIARKFGSKPHKLLIEHFGEIKTPATIRAAAGNLDLAGIVAASTTICFRTIEYNEEPYYMRTLALIEMRCGNGRTTIDEGRCATPVLNISETHYADGHDPIGVNRKYKSDLCTHAPAWALERFERSLSMLHGED